MTSRTRYHALEATRATLIAHGSTHPSIVAAVQDLNDAAPRFLQACQRIQDARPSDLTAASSDGKVNGTGAGASKRNPDDDPDTEEARLTSTEDHAYGLLTGSGIGAHARHDQQRIDSSLNTLLRHSAYPDGHETAIAAAARTLWKITAAWTPHAASDRDRRSVEKANATPVPECAHTRSSVGKFEPALATSDCGGVLPEPLPLCRWVYDFTRRAGRLPSDREMELHHQGRTVRLPA